MKNKLLIAMLVLGLILTGCGKKEEKKDREINIFAADGIETTAVVAKDNNLIITSVSNDTRNIDLLYIDIAFYNENELVSTTNSFINNLKAKSTGISVIELPKDQDGNIEKITKIDIKTHKNIAEEETKELLNDKIETSTENTESNEIKLKIKNTSEKTIEELNVTAVFYKNDEIIGASTSYLFNVSENAETIVNKPYITVDGNSEEVEYDNVKININTATKNKE